MLRDGQGSEEAWEVSKMTEVKKSTIFEKMWKREGFRAELRAANALAVKQ